MTCSPVVDMCFPCQNDIDRDETFISHLSFGIVHVIGVICLLLPTAQCEVTGHACSLICLYNFS